MKYLLYLRSSEEVRRYIEKLREDIAPAIMSVSGHESHCTLMRAYLHESEELVVIKKLARIPFPSLQLRTKEIAVFKEGDLATLVLRLEKTAALAQLHQQVIDAVGRSIFWEEMPPLPREHENDRERYSVYRQYGSSFCAQFYQPHISIGHVNPLLLPSLTREIPEMIWEGRDLIFAKKEEKWKVIQLFKNNSKLL